MSLSEIENIPGTVHLVDIEGNLHVKHDSGGNQYIILRPPPSSNINDPLRWSKQKKLKQFFVIWVLAVFLALTVAWSAPNWVTWAKDLNCTLQQLNNAMALTFCFLGLGCLFLQPTALKLGRRFVYMGCTVLMIIAQIIGSRATKIQEIYAVFIITGFAAAPCDSLTEISVTDFFYQHERSTFVALCLFGLYFGNYIAPIVSGYVVDGLGWRWSYYLQIMMFGLIFIVLAFYMEDTTFRRSHDDSYLETDILEQIKSRESMAGPEKKSDIKTEVKGVLATSVSELEDNEDANSIDYSIPLRSYWQKMRVIQTEYNDERSWLCIWYRPFFMATFPAIIWGGIIYGAQMMWLSVISVTQASIFTAPPYNFTGGQTGLINFAPLIGNFFGMLYGGKFVDWLTIKLAQRNNGIMEPEFRLYAMIVPTITNAVGLLTYGLANHNGAPWPVAVVIGLGFLGFSMSATGGICLTYSIDCYSKMASEGMVLLLFLRNMIGMTFTLVFQYWLDACGLKLLTWLLFMLSLVINGSFIFMIFFGKKFRKMTAHRYERFSDPKFGELFNR